MEPFRLSIVTYRQGRTEDLRFRKKQSSDSCSEMADNLEPKIIERITQGEAYAFEFLVKKYQRPLFVMVGNILRESNRVEDIVQEVFLSAYKNIHSFNPDIGRFSTWLFRIARNKCFNEIKQKKEQPVSELPDIMGLQNPVDDLLAKEVFIKLDNALNQLPFSHRTVFVLAELQGLSYAEIAQIEGISIGTVKSRLARTREKLRRILKEFAG